jgi:hypothetical protein
VRFISGHPHLLPGLPRPNIDWKVTSGLIRDGKAYTLAPAA